jgi:thymidylate synthase
MNKIDKAYTDLLQDILDNGTKKETRNGGTISVFGRQIRHKMSEGFPLLTTKKMSWNSIVTELLWFLRGDTNIKFLVDNNCHIWDGDAYKFFKNSFPIKKSNPPKDYINEDGQLLTQEEFINKIKTDDEFAYKWGELGPIYGKQWRSWHTGWDVVEDKSKEAGVRRIEYGIDQIANLINDLKTNPDSRRLLVSAWNPADLDSMVLPPCHYGFQVYTRELSLGERTEYKKKRDGIARTFAPYTHQMLDGSNIPTRAISLMWNQRSVDTFLGLPFNIASYGLLLEIIAKAVNMVPDELIGNLGDVHLYSNHVEQAKEQIGRERTHEEMVEIYYVIENKKDREEYWTWETRFEDNNITKRTREPYPLPTLKHLRSDDKYKLLSEFPLLWNELKIDDFQIENYQSHPTIKAPLSN